MEEIREIALAYYHNLSDKNKQNAHKLFEAMDLNGDGKVTLNESLETFRDLMGLSQLYSRNLFAGLDRNGDGILDFEEFLSLYYLLMSGRMVFCDGHDCGAFLKGLYFTCVNCFLHDSKTTYDLCSSCFRRQNYGHHHDDFLDNYTLLLSMRTTQPSASQEDTTTIGPQSAGKQPSSSQGDTTKSRSRRSRREKVKVAMEAFNTGYSFGQAIVNVGSSCNMM